MRPRSIDVHVERLVLHGTLSADRDRIADAVAQELARALGDGEIPGAWLQSAHSDRVDAGSFHTTPDPRPESIGTGVARRVLQGSVR